MEVNGVYILFEALQLTPMLTPTLYRCEQAIKQQNAKLPSLALS